MKYDSTEQRFSKSGENNVLFLKWEDQGTQNTSPNLGKEDSVPREVWFEI